MEVKQIVCKEARARFGLGKFLQGSLRAVTIIMKYHRYGLRYKPNAKIQSKMVNLRREKKIASLVGAIVEGEHMVFPHLRETFHLVGVHHEDIKPSETIILEDFEEMSVNAIKGMDVKEEDIRAMVRPTSSGAAPRN